MELSQIKDELFRIKITHEQLVQEHNKVIKEMKDLKKGMISMYRSSESSLEGTQ